MFVLECVLSKFEDNEPFNGVDIMASNVIKTGLIMALLFYASMVNATIVVQSTLNDVCVGLPGAWKGSGNVSASGINCKYKGVANVSSTNDEHHFNIIIDLTKTSGALCPNNEHLNYVGACENGVLVIQSNDANLSGTTDGTNAHLSGQVIIKIAGVPVTANVDMSLVKQ